MISQSLSSPHFTFSAPLPHYILKESFNPSLLVRFDITKNNGRFHMISMQTLLQADGYYHINYWKNTDDHLKNFCMLHKKAGYYLSPVYDLLPDIYERREHTLSSPFGAGYLPPDRTIL